MGHYCNLRQDDHGKLLWYMAWDGQGKAGLSIEAIDLEAGLRGI